MWGGLRGLRSRRGFGKLAGFERHMQCLSWFPHFPIPNPTMHHSHYSQALMPFFLCISSLSSYLPSLVLHNPRRPPPYLSNNNFLVLDAITGTTFFFLDQRLVFSENSRKKKIGKIKTDF